MSDPAEVLMVSGVARPCPDCGDDAIFVPIDECEGDACEFCCTTCGAALLVDPAFDYAVVTVRVA